MPKFGGFGASNPNNNQVILNIYDLSDNNAIFYPWGMGLYHSGVQIGREEYTFAGQAGIFTHEAKNAPGAVFREAINLGVFKGTTRDLETIIQSLRPNYKGSDYHVLKKNCNSFANEFVQRLLGIEIPSWVNRAANIGSYFSCFLPDQMANNAPVDQSDGSGSGSGGSSSSSYTGYTRMGTASSNSSAPSVTSSTAFSQPGRKIGVIGNESYSSSSSAAVGSQEERRQKFLNAATTRSYGGGNQI